MKNQRGNIVLDAAVFLIASVFLIAVLICWVNGTPEKKGIDNTVVVDIPVIRMDGCQYLQMKSAYNYYIYTHKGNCDNPIHKSN